MAHLCKGNYQAVGGETQKKIICDIAMAMNGISTHLFFQCGHHKTDRVALFYWVGLYKLEKPK